MSIAAVQRQLSTSKGGKVSMKAYLTLLCESLGASMIADQDSLTIEVTVDDSSVEADVSVSLGLIVTELVINALKHAFLGQQKGRITVSYASEGDDWTLSVGDDGIGMPEGQSAPKRCQPDAPRSGQGSIELASRAAAHLKGSGVLHAVAHLTPSLAVAHCFRLVFGRDGRFPLV
jgi:LytS/YehU family sensor histidine kinase